MATGEKTERKILKVAEITRLIKNCLEREFDALWIEGELSNISQPVSGHLYFTLKDESAQIRAVMWRGDCRALGFVPRDGMLVQVFGEITVYERGGNYQVIARQMVEAGKGSLQAAFEALKKKLQEEGLFDESRKKPIPLLPRRVGIVTSPTGAAIRDILKVVTRRFPNMHLVLAPVRVQGEGAAEEIAAAVDLFNTRGGMDVLIVGRGGGSLEDLWCFNEEVVARAIARSRIPVISAVGHETDFTISDFVADLRAPTPSAAAEMVVNRKDAFEERLDHFSKFLVRSLRECGLALGSRLAAAAGSYVFREPQNLVARHRQSLETLGLRMRHGIRDRLTDVRQRTDEAGLRMSHGLKEALVAGREGIRRFEVQLRALSPVAVLERGYSLTSDGSGKILRSVDELERGARVTTRLARGSFESEVVATHGKAEK